MLAARRCRSRLALAASLLAANGLACDDGLWYTAKGSEVFPYPFCEVAGSDMIWLHDERPTDYRGAQRACAFYGAPPIIIQDEETNERVALGCGLRSCWIGSSVTYSNWAAGEPNNYMNVDEDKPFINSCGIPPDSPLPNHTSWGGKEAVGGWKEA
eukprot:TRINITY_DN3882_c0_g2_i1.p1 TRINITY_DN3882_c0_g2~~TRINITY_DN3882_c0_g2_i1.p1  ORF type:complete len:156 (-),score=1.51 TRINITY_DN3882_c0_g2_i1:7-474(-)